MFCLYIHCGQAILTSAVPQLRLPPGDSHLWADPRMQSPKKYRYLHATPRLQMIVQIQVFKFWQWNPRLRQEIHEVAGRQPVPWSRRRRPLPSKLFQEFRLSAVVVFFNALWVYVQLRKPWPGHRKDSTVTRKSPISLWKLDVSNSASKNTRPHEVCLCMKVWKGFTNLRGEFHKPGRCISANLRLPCA